MLLLSVLFLVKAIYLAFFVTPLWDIPDETGHLAYVMHIAAGEGIPVLGTAMIPTEVLSHMYGIEVAAAHPNWIAQHPPLYYHVAAVPYSVAQYFTSDVEILFRVPRIIAAISGTLLLLVLYRTARLVGLSDRAALCLAGCLGWVPMFSHLSSGTNHDVPLFLAGALAVHYFARFVLRHELRDAYVAAIWLSVAGAMKMTAWVLLPPFVLVVAWELRGDWRTWAVHVSGVGATALSMPAAWMVRNLLVYGAPTYLARTDRTWRLEEPLQRSFTEFLNTQPVFEHFLLNYYGLIGWAGTGVGQLQWFQLGGFPLAVFTIALLIVGAVLLVQFYEALRRPPIMAGGSSRFADVMVSAWLRRQGLWPNARILTAIVAVGVFAALTYFSMKGGVGMNLRLVGIATVLALGTGAFIAVLFESRDDRRLFLYGIAAFLFFSLVVLVQIYGVHLLDGRLRATHGRYFYPVLPWLLLSLSLALAGRAWGERLLMLAFPLMILAEVDAYLNQVLPFIGGGAR